MITLRFLNRLTPEQQARQLRCPNALNCNARAGASCNGPHRTCEKRWIALRKLREQLAFDQLGGKHHTGVPCPYCRALPGEFCVNTNHAAHPIRATQSVAAARRLVNNTAGVS